jgi:hypothetical protein
VWGHTAYRCLMLTQVTDLQPVNSEMMRRLWFDVKLEDS